MYIIMKTQAKLAFVHDSLIVTKAALKSTLKRNDSIFHNNFRHGEFFNHDFPGIYCYPNNDRDNLGRPFQAFEHGRMISKAMHSVKFF